MFGLKGKSPHDEKQMRSLIKNFLTENEIELLLARNQKPIYLEDIIKIRHKLKEKIITLWREIHQDIKKFENIKSYKKIKALKHKADILMIHSPQKIQDTLKEEGLLSIAEIIIYSRAKAFLSF